MISKSQKVISGDFSTSLPRLKEQNLLKLKTDYNSNQKSTILSKVNSSAEDELEEFDISQQRLKKILQRRKKQGDFTAIEEILELDGFGVKVLEKFYNSILAEKNDSRGLNDKSDSKTETVTNDKTNDLPENQKDSKASRKKVQFVQPPLHDSVRSSIKSIVSFHADLNFIAWTKLRLEPNESSPGQIVVEEWMTQEISCEDDKKLSLIDLIKILMPLCKEIPSGDVYVVEAQQMSTASQQGATSIQININVEKAQLIAMLSILMASRSSSPKTSSSDEEPKASVNALKNTSKSMPLYFLRNFLASRLYKILVGNERVSANDVVESIFNYGESISKTENASLSAVDVPWSLKEQYSKSGRVEREYMGQSMLIGLTFLKLCVLKCPHTAASVMKKKL